ncbi:MAG: glycoside hydrolase family protein [Solirubrobacterales bacterium]
MNDVFLKLTKYNNCDKFYWLQDYCATIKLSNTITQIAAELTFEIPFGTFSSSLLAINVEVGDVVTLWYTSKKVFNGKVIDIDLKGKAQTLKVTCYDYCWWLCKCNITKNFNNITIKQAIAEVYETIGINNYSAIQELGANGDVILESHLVKDKPAHKVLSAIYNEVTKSSTSGVYYYMHQDDTGQITITQVDKYFSGITIQAPTNMDTADGNLIDFEITESMANMVNRVAVSYDDGSEVQINNANDGTAKNLVTMNDTDFKRFGRIQESLTVDTGYDVAKAKTEALDILKEKNKLTEELTTTCKGDIDYKVGYGTLVKIPGTAYYDIFMYILSSEWAWNKDGSFTSKLTLTKSTHLDVTEFADIEEKQSTTSSATDTTNSDLVNRILTELKKYLGLPYKWNGKSPADGGMDCSGYIAYVYNQFASELSIISGDRSLHSYTYTMMNEGKDVTSDFPSNLRQGDIIFPTADHVVAYIGNNKVIHSPHSGDVIKISDIWFTKPAKVIRVIPDSAWASKTSGANTGSVSANLIDFVKGWEKFRATVYDDGYGNLTIGYGTTSGSNPSAIKQGVCTESQATTWLKIELNNCALSVTKKLKSIGVSLPQNKFDVLCDMTYNMDPSNFEGLYTLIKNGASDDEIRNKLMVYNHVGANVVNGLTKRCAARVKIWFNGVYDSTH